MQQECNDKIDIMDSNMQKLHAQMQELQSELKKKDLLLRGKEEELGQAGRHIKALEAEIEMLKNSNAMGDQATAELQKLLAETQQKLQKALSDISDLEARAEKKEQEHAAETGRLNTEIERLNNILKATGQDKEEQVMKLNAQIADLKN